MSLTPRRAAALMALTACLPFSVHAHRAWMLPSATVLSGTDKWVTVDAAVSNDLFYFEHVPFRLDNLSVTGPDGAAIKPENLSTGRYRSTFDVHLLAEGTYKIASVANNVFARYEENGEQKMWRGTADKMAKEVPAGAKNLQVSKMNTRIEVFVTLGKPSKTVLAPTGVGLEIVPVTHPNDLVVGEEAKFTLLQDGKPAANVEVSMIPGGIRYRDSLNEIKVTTDAEGRFSAKFAQPGMYWMNATVSKGGPARREGPPPSEGGNGWQAGGAAAPQGGVSAGPRPGGPRGGGPRQGGPGGPGGRMPAGDRASYTAVIEVLPQ